MAYRDFKDLPRRTISNKVLHDKTLNVAKNSKYNEYQRGFASNVFQFFNKEKSGGAVKNEIMLNQELAEESHKPIIRKIEK